MAGPIGSTEIAERHQSKPDTPNRNYTAAITETARDLAGKRDPDEYPGRDIWTTRPILTGSKGEWDLTTYGRVLAVFIDGEQWQLNTRRISDREFQEVFDELNLPQGIFVEQVD